MGARPRSKSHSAVPPGELYFWLRYGTADPESSHSRLEALQVDPQRPTPDASDPFSLNVNPLTDLDVLRALLGNELAPDESALLAAKEPAVSSD